MESRHIKCCLACNECKTPFLKSTVFHDADDILRSKNQIGPAQSADQINMFFRASWTPFCPQKKDFHVCGGFPRANRERFRPLLFRSRYDSETVNYGVLLRARIRILQADSRTRDVSSTVYRHALTPSIEGGVADMRGILMSKESLAR